MPDHPLNRIELGNRLMQVRTGNGLTQKEFGEALGISWRSYQNYEIGSRVVTAEAILALYLVFSVDPVWLLTGKGREKRIDDPQALLEVLEQVEGVRAKLGYDVPPVKKAKIIEKAFFNQKEGKNQSEEDLIDWFELVKQDDEYK